MRAPLNTAASVSRKGQTGAALILSLLILLVLTLLAISSMQGTVLQERMVSAEREGMLSLEIAESGLRDAEVFLESLSSTASFDGSDGLFGLNDTPPDPLLASTWAGNNSREGNEVQGVTPRFFIKYVGVAERPDDLTDIVVGGYSHETGDLETEGFRIVAWSPGLTGESRRIIESFYTRSF